MSALNLLDGIVYINLAKRLDRKKSIEKEFRKVGIDSNKVVRIEACLDELNGCRGCVYSHIKALDFALNTGWKNVLVLEDDCIFVKERPKIDTYVMNFFQHFQNNWDIFFLGTRTYLYRETNHQGYIQVLFSLRAHSYIVNGHYLSKLKKNFITTYQSMEHDLFFIDSIKKALDVQWIGLQMCDRWFVGTDMITKQKGSYSDIEKKVRRRR